MMWFPKTFGEFIRLLWSLMCKDPTFPRPEAAGKCPHCRKPREG
jgi:hypothetical protein